MTVRIRKLDNSFFPQGDDVNSCDSEGRSALDWAVIRSNIEFVKLLLDAGKWFSFWMRKAFETLKKKPVLLTSFLQFKSVQNDFSFRHSDSSKVTKFSR